MSTPLHERLRALREFMSPPSANAADEPALELLDEAVRALTPPKLGEIAPSAVEMPWPNLPAGSRLVTSAYPRSVVADYGNARATERDWFWRTEVDRLRAERDELAKDAARLDWLENGGQGTVEIFRFELFDYQALKHERGFVINKAKAEKSLRAAIDAARAELTNKD